MSRIVNWAVVGILIALLASELLAPQSSRQRVHAHLSQDKQPLDKLDKGLDSKAIDNYVFHVLRDLINRGVEIYTAGDHAGCYRLYEGALIMVRPLLNHRPELQKNINSGLVYAAREEVVWKRAFILRETLDHIRREVRSLPEPDPVPDPTKEKTKEPKDKVKESTKDKTPKNEKPENKDKGKDPTKSKETEKEPKDKTSKTPPEFPEIKDKKEQKQQEVGEVSGLVRLNGKPLTKGVLTFHGAPGETYSAPIGQDGSYRIAKVPLNNYRLTVTMAVRAVPAKYADAKTSSLAAEINDRKTVIVVELDE